MHLFLGDIFRLQIFIFSLSSLFKEFLYGNTIGHTDETQFLHTKSKTLCKTKNRNIEKQKNKISLGDSDFRQLQWISFLFKSDNIFIQCGSFYLFF